MPTCPNLSWAPGEPLNESASTYLWKRQRLLSVDIEDAAVLRHINSAGLQNVRELEGPRFDPAAVRRPARRMVVFVHGFLFMLAVIVIVALAQCVALPRHRQRFLGRFLMRCCSSFSNNVIAKWRRDPLRWRHDVRIRPRFKTLLETRARAVPTVAQPALGEGGTDDLQSVWQRGGVASTHAWTAVRLKADVSAVRLWQHNGRRKDGVGAWILLDFEIWHFPITFSAKKVVFLISGEKNGISRLLPPPGKIFLAASGKMHYWPPSEKILSAPMDGMRVMFSGSPVRKELGRQNTGDRVFWKTRRRASGNGGEERFVLISITVHLINVPLFFLRTLPIKKFYVGRCCRNCGDDLTIIAAFATAVWWFRNRVGRRFVRTFVQSWYQGRTQVWGFGVETSPLSLVLQKLYYKGRAWGLIFYKREVRVEEYAYYDNKLRLKTWIWRQIVKSQTTHTKYERPPYATEWNSPWKLSAYATAWYRALLTPLLPMFAILSWKYSSGKS